MKYSELNGNHMLSAVDTDVVGITFILDDKAYIIMEDGDDDYRSYAGEIEPYGGKIINRFPGQRVVVKGDEDWFEVYDAKNDRLIMKVGTDYSDTYYPMAVFEWYPQDMSINTNVMFA